MSVGSHVVLLAVVATFLASQLWREQWPAEPADEAAIVDESSSFLSPQRLVLFAEARKGKSRQSKKSTKSGSGKNAPAGSKRGQRQRRSKIYGPVTSDPSAPKPKRRSTSIDLERKRKEAATLQDQGVHIFNAQEANQQQSSPSAARRSSRRKKSKLGGVRAMRPFRAQAIAAAEEQRRQANSAPMEEMRKLHPTLVEEPIVAHECISGLCKSCQPLYRLPQHTCLPFTAPGVNESHILRCVVPAEEGAKKERREQCARIAFLEVDVNAVKKYRRQPTAQSGAAATASSRAGRLEQKRDAKQPQKRKQATKENDVPRVLQRAESTTGQDGAYIYEQTAVCGKCQPMKGILSSYVSRRRRLRVMHNHSISFGMISGCGLLAAKVTVRTGCDSTCSSCNEEIDLTPDTNAQVSRPQTVGFDEKATRVTYATLLRAGPCAAPIIEVRKFQGQRCMSETSSARTVHFPADQCLGFIRASHPIVRGPKGFKYECPARAFVDAEAMPQQTSFASPVQHAATFGLDNGIVVTQKDINSIFQQNSERAVSVWAAEQSLLSARQRLLRYRLAKRMANRTDITSFLGTSTHSSRLGGVRSIKRRGRSRGSPAEAGSGALGNDAMDVDERLSEPIFPFLTEFV